MPFDVIELHQGDSADLPKHGYATIGSGVVVAPDTVLSVDVAAYPWAYNEFRGPGGWAGRTPVICVDIVSPWDRPAQL